MNDDNRPTICDCSSMTCIHRTKVNTTMDAVETANVKRKIDEDDSALKTPNIEYNYTAMKHGLCNALKEHRMRWYIMELCDNVSKMKILGSYMFNLYVKERLSNGKGLDLKEGIFRHCMTINNCSNVAILPGIIKVYSDHFLAKFPPTVRMVGDTSIINDAVTEYWTNLQNMCVKNYNTKQFSFIMHYWKFEKNEKNKAWDIQNRINRVQNEEEKDKVDEYSTFIAHQRSMIFDSNVLLGAPITRIVEENKHAEPAAKVIKIVKKRKSKRRKSKIKIMNKRRNKKFPTSPVFQKPDNYTKDMQQKNTFEKKLTDSANPTSVAPTKCRISKTWIEHHVELVLSYLYKLLCYFEQNGMRSYDIVPIHKIQRHHIQLDTTALFYIMKECRLLDTEMVGITIGQMKKNFLDNRQHYWNMCFNIPKSKKEFGCTVTTNGQSMSFLYKTSTPAVHFEPKRKKIYVKPNIPDVSEIKVLGIDPGRVNIQYATDGEKHWKLSRKQYYSEAGLYRAIRNSNRWNREIEVELNLLSQVSTKTSNFQESVEHVRMLSTVFVAIWGNYSKTRWNQQRFRTYCGKKSCLDRFYSHIDTFDNRQQTIIAYGAATFPSSGKNEISVPTTSAYKACRRHFKEVVLVDEYMTSQTCRHCLKTRGIFSKVEGCWPKNRGFPARGLRRCTNTECHRLVNRDFNSACLIRDNLIETKTLHNIVEQSINTSKGGVAIHYGLARL